MRSMTSYLATAEGINSNSLVSPGADQVVVSAQPVTGTAAAGVRNLLQSGPTLWTIQLAPSAGNAAAAQTELAALARRSPDQLVQMLRNKGACR